MQVVLGPCDRPLKASGLGMEQYINDQQVAWEAPAVVVGVF
jgi:hypothetical protein